MILMIQIPKKILKLQIMQTDKKLTLQQYIECHNIKKQLQQRSKEKSRSKSRDKTTSLPHLPQPHDTSFLSPNHAAQNQKISTHQILNNTIYDQVDYRARNLYKQLQQEINEIKLECRAIIKNDKDFAFFLKLMDALINKFRAAVMHIHRENILLFQMSREADKTYLTQKDDLARTHIQNLEKSFNEQYELSKSQYESNLNFISNKTIKQKMQQNQKGEEMVKAIFGGFSQETVNQKKSLKKYDTEPKDQKERQERKQEAVSFLGFIMRNIASNKKSEQKQTKLQTPSLSSNLPSGNTKILPTYKSSQQNQNFIGQNQTKKQYDKKDQKKQSLDKKQKKEDDRIIKNINYLNSRPKNTIHTEEIDKNFSEQNVSFQNYSPSIKSVEKLKVSIPKLPIKKQEKQLTKIGNKNYSQKLNEKVMKVKKTSEKQVDEKEIIPQVNELNRKKITQNQPPGSPINRIQLIQRKNTRSKGKPTNKFSATKKAL